MAVTNQVATVYRFEQYREIADELLPESKLLLLLLFGTSLLLSGVTTALSSSPPLTLPVSSSSTPASRLSPSLRPSTSSLVSLTSYPRYLHLQDPSTLPLFSSSVQTISVSRPSAGPLTLQFLLSL